MYVPWLHGNEPEPEWWLAWKRRIDTDSKQSPVLKRLDAERRQRAADLRAFDAGHVDWVVVSWP